jgi:Ca2+-binding RTX toxin-like protein
MRPLYRTSLAAALVAAGLVASADSASARYTQNVPDGTLLVQGDEESDTLTIRSRADNLEVVDADGIVDYQVKRSAVLRIEVEMGGGDDQISIDDSQGAFTDTIPTLLDGQDGNDAIVGGRGGEVLFGGEGADLLLGGAGADSILGEGGDDHIFGGAGVDKLDGGAGVNVVVQN